ncbi:thioredoxin family protein [Planctomycetota bacterium]
MSVNEKGKNTGLAMKVGIVVALVVAVIAVILLKNTNREEDINVVRSSKPVETAPVVESQPGKEAIPVETKKPAAIPKLVDLGAETCIPCKMMAPILEDLKKTYEGKLEVQFIDVKKNSGAGQEYGIKLIPTQIFFDASGKELFRHEGFYSKDDILKKWKELGIDFETPAEEPDAKQGRKDKVVVPQGKC